MARRGLLTSSSILTMILLCLLLTTTRAYTPPVKRASLVVSRINVTLDGIPNTLTVINGTYPGPELRFFPGDTILINVTNALENDNTTMHWHGLSQRLTPYADGTPQSQWPIAPGKWFEYEMRPKNADIGTRFYHTHVGLQSISANGAFIVVDPKPPFKYDHDVSLVVTDYWHKNEETMIDGLQSTNFVWVGTPNITMINGKGLSNELRGEPYILDVQYNSIYYLRFIGAQGLLYYQYSLFNHTLTLVEVDGTYVKPVPLSSLELAAGQRIGALLHTKSQSEVRSDDLDGCYWMRFETQFRSPASMGWMVVRYPGGCSQFKVPIANNSAPVLPASKLPWISDTLEPLSSNTDRTPPGDEQVTRRIVLWTQQVLALNSATRVLWPVNGEVYNETTDMYKTPYMIRLYQNDTDRPSYSRAMALAPMAFGDEDYTQRSWDPVSKTWTAKANEVIDIVIINNASAISNRTEVHPWHFHSAKFWHMGSGLGIYSPESYDAVRAHGAYKHPILKDTVTVYPGIIGALPKNSSGSWVVLRYRVSGEEAGVWPLHCHIAPHLMAGMATNFAIAPDQITRQLDLYSKADPNYFVYGENVRSPYTMAQLRGTTGNGARERRKMTWLTVAVGAGGAAVILLEVGVIMLLWRVDDRG